MDTNQSAASFKSSATKSGLTPLQLSEFHNFSYIMILCQQRELPTTYHPCGSLEVGASRLIVTFTS